MTTWAEVRERLVDLEPADRRRCWEVANNHERPKQAPFWPWLAPLMTMVIDELVAWRASSPPRCHPLRWPTTEPGST